MVRESDLVAIECALRRVHMECEAEHNRVTVLQQDYLARLRASTINHRCSTDFDWVLSGHQFTLSMQEADL
jgi:hypothetical protein